MNRLLSLIFCNIYLAFLSKFSTAADTITRNQTISDNQSLVSASGTFKLGFFNPGNSSKRFLGIWFNNIPPQTVFWVANGDNPVPDSSGILSISSNGNLVILNQTQGVIWSSNSSRTAKNPVVTLLDSGNLVLKEEGSDNSEANFIWQSFDYPSDTLIAGMKLGLNLRSHMNWYLTSWKKTDDPSSGDFTYKVDPSGLAQLILRKGIEVQYRSGPWDGVRFGGGPELNANGVFNPSFVVNSDEVYYSFKNINDSEISRFVVTSSGSLDQLSWSNRRHEWINIITLQKDSCDTFAKCGAYGTCNINKSPFCSCLRGFEPKSPDDWAVLDWFSGCIPVKSTNCGIEEGFKKFSALKLPDQSHIQGSINLSRVECEAVCLRNCSCSAYAMTEVSGCVVWYGELIDIREYSEGGQDLYIRMAKSEIDSGKKKPVVIIAVISVIVGLLLLGSISWWIIWKKRAKRRENKLKIQENAKQDLELPFFDLGTIATATDNFANMIGKGGFGSVYKGELPSGQEIAVKRLSKNSGQGIEEFKNEVILIAKLQHRSLVKLLGCCVEGEERMLIYEYMSNKSLDSFIFDQTRENALKWQKRFDIIVGIARGLLYLHQDSRLTIIHRDLKASNILLDIKMNPKISDFGIARIFRADQIEANTKRVVGTYGYMSPEYAIDGIFSMKSDVYSFGVILLEIVSGKKNRGFVHPDHDFNLLGHAWKLWYEGKALEVVDELMKESFPMSEVLRCIQVGLLCVQHHPNDRPTMSSVVLMLGSEIAPLPQPKKPGFYTERFMVDNDSSSTSKISYTSNDVTVTLLDGR